MRNKLTEPNNDNVININDLKKKKETEDDGLYREYLDGEEFVISYKQDYESLKRSIDSLWNQIYCGKKVTVLYADDDGKIGFYSRWVNSLRLDPDYERSSDETLAIMREFINDNSLATKFMKFYGEEVEKRDILKLFVLQDGQEKTTSL